MRLAYLVVALLFSFCANSFAFDHKHQLLDEVLKTNVRETEFSSSVSYLKLYKDQAKLNKYLTLISSVNKSEFNLFSKDEKLSFLINAYNAFTIKLILKNYPVKSIKDTGSFFSSPWKIEFFKLFGEDTYLDKIEHEMIRKWFKEPRIHFAVVCASIGCPALQGEAFTSIKLEFQLEKGAKKFLSDISRNYYDSKENEVYLSKIFKWYGEDFQKKSGSVLNFVRKYMPSAQEINNNSEINYLPYNWKLNK